MSAANTQVAVRCPYSSQHTADPSTPACATCGRPWIRCPACQAPNRLMSRCCRRCQQAWPDEGLTLRTGRRPHLRWKTRIEGRPVSALPVPPDEVLVTLEDGGAVLMGPASATPLFSGALVPGARVIAPPALVQGVLLVAQPERLHACDLVDRIQLSPGTPRRSAVLELPGEPWSRVVSDRGHQAACVTRQGATLSVHGFSQSGRDPLAFAWTRALPSRAVDEEVAIAFLGPELLVVDRAGHALCLNPADGTPTAQFDLPEALAVSTVSDTGVVGGVSGVVYQFSPRPQGLGSPFAHPITWLGASAEHVVTCHGTQVRHIPIRGGSPSTMPLPDAAAADPVVSASGALVVTQGGTLICLEIRTGEVVPGASLKLFSGTGVDPLSPVVSGQTVYSITTRGEVACVAWEEPAA